MRVGYLMRDRQERFNLKRAWYVTAWRIVDEEGCDLVQPWCNTKTDARNLAARLDIEIRGEKA